MDAFQWIDSPEMREHLKKVQFSERVCEELVCGAPRPLAEATRLATHFTRLKLLI